MADIEENARRKAAGKKEIALSPIAIEVVRRIDALFKIERTINGKSAEERLVVRRALSRPLVEDLHAYMRDQIIKTLSWARPRQSIQLHFEAVGELHSVP
jgi:transposase